MQADKDKIQQQNKASVRNQLDRLLDSIEGAEKLTDAHPRPHPLDDTTLKNDAFNLDESVIFGGVAEQHNQSMHAMMGGRRQPVDDIELTGRNELHNADPAIMPLSQTPHTPSSNQSSGPIIR